MPGRKTANKCSTCRQRKIKCGLQSPACLQCQKGGWVCPGYDNETRFHAYRNPIKISNDRTGSGSSSSGSTATPSDSSSLVERRIGMRWISMFPPSKEDSLRNELIFKITFDAVAARLMVISKHNILRQIPARIGRSRALDDAVICICHPPAPGKDSLSMFPSRYYATALPSLQRALQDEVEGTATETLAAATLLQMYEHSTNHSQQSWIAHANGVIRMLELRGPSRIENELENAILRAEIGNIFIKALSEGVPCFLAEPAWRDVIFPESFVATGSTHSAFAAIIDVGIFMPGVLEHYRSFKLASSAIGCSSSANELVAELRDVHRRALEWQVRYDPDQVDIKINQDDTMTERLSHAARISFKTFLILLLYMLLDVCNSELPQDLKADLQMYVIQEEAALRPHIARFEGLSAGARFETETLYAEDKMAGAQTVWLMQMMLERVLGVPQAPLLSDIRQIMCALRDDLAYIMEPLRPLPWARSRATRSNA